MAKPVLLAVDDDPKVCEALARDLGSRYSDRYQVRTAATAGSALDMLDALKAQEEVVALVLAEENLPRVSGADFLERAGALFPDAKRVLLTVYTDTEAAIRAIDNQTADYYLLMPWDPPEERLYPALDELLDDWQAHYRPAFPPLRVIGHRWSPELHDIRDFLARYQVPYEWRDLDTSEEARQELAARGTPRLPLIIFPDGTALEDPTHAQVAERLGLPVHAHRRSYDLIIVGGGPAGLGAGVYAASEGLRAVMVECEAPGGQAGTSSRIENYLGFPAGISGAELTRRAVTQARRFGLEFIVAQEVTAVRRAGPYRIVALSDGSEIACFAVLIATGVSYRRLEVPGIERLTGAGVYYGSTMTEAPTCADQDVFLVGGANSAGQAAVYFARYAHTVTMLVRGDSLEASMSQYLIDHEAIPNIRVWVNTVVVAVEGETNLKAITVRHTDTGETQTLPAIALFILIGALPHTDWLAGCVERDKDGYILAGRALIRDGQRPLGWTLDRDPYLLETSVPGVFVAGDVRHGSVKRVASAVGEGAMAVQFVHQYLDTVR